MKIQTKYNVGDKVHTVEQMRFVEAEIYRIDIEVTEGQVKVTYYLHNEDKSIIIKKEGDLFTSKEDMLRFMSGIE